MEQQGYVKRIILLTDGQVTTGKRKDSDFIDICTKIKDAGISVVSIGLGSDYNEDLLSLIANSSDGQWHHIRDPLELVRIFKNQFQELKTVMMTKPKLQFKLMSGTDFSDIYRVRPMLVKIDNVNYSNGVIEIPLNDVVKGKSQDIVFRLSLPSRDLGNYRIANITLIDGANISQSKDITINYTNDASLYLHETDDYPRILLHSTANTVLIREGITKGDQTIIRTAQQQMNTILRDGNVQITVRNNPLLNDIVTVINQVSQQTVLNEKLTDEQKKELKSKTTIIP